MLGRVIILDESISLPLLRQLHGRGRSECFHVNTMLGKRTPDERIVEFISERYPGCVFVTADDHIPAQYKDLLPRLDIAVATIVKQHLPHYLHQETCIHETVHHWLRVIELQKVRTQERYTPMGHKPWAIRARSRAKTS